MKSGTAREAGLVALVANVNLASAQTMDMHTPFMLGIKGLFGTDKAGAKHEVTPQWDLVLSP